MVQVIILDFGSQTTKLIARRVRELGIYAEIFPYSTPLEKIKQLNPKLIILSGGPASVIEEGSPSVNKEIFNLGIPILGICYGLQLMAHLLGGKVEKCKKREYGKAILDVDSQYIAQGEVFEDIGVNPQVWMSHGDSVSKLPEGFKVIASTKDTPFTAVIDQKRKFIGFQFHPEVAHTLKGKEIIKRAVFKMAGCEKDWTMDDFIKNSKNKIQKQVGENGKVVLGLSGGVDSSVVAALLHKSIGNRLYCIYVDNGLMRKNETEELRKAFKNNFKGINIKIVDAKERFINALKGVIDPEQKRKVIGKLFIEVFEEAAKGIGKVNFLAQGTIYPDVIESVSVNGSSSVIKSHHNVGGLPEKMGLELVEPLRELFKDEVRKAGELLGLPKELVWRHPYPGPGLAIRIKGEIIKEKLEILREADAIFIEEVKKAGWYGRIWQAFVVLTSDKTVGVMGDSRTYDYVAALRAVESTDVMTADWARLPYDLLATVSNRITREVPGISRIVLDITSKPPATVEWE